MVARTSPLVAVLIASARLVKVLADGVMKSYSFPLAVRVYEKAVLRLDFSGIGDRSPPPAWLVATACDPASTTGGGRRPAGRRSRRSRGDRAVGAGDWRVGSAHRGSEAIRDACRAPDMSCADAVQGGLFRREAGLLVLEQGDGKGRDLLRARNDLGEIAGVRAAASEDRIGCAAHTTLQYLFPPGTGPPCGAGPAGVRLPLTISRGAGRAPPAGRSSPAPWPPWRPAPGPAPW